MPTIKNVLSFSISNKISCTKIHTIRVKQFTTVFLNFFFSKLPTIIVFKIALADNCGQAGGQIVRNNVINPKRTNQTKIQTNEVTVVGGATVDECFIICWVCANTTAVQNW